VRFANSHNATPSRNASRRSPGANERPRVSSIQVRVSLAACGVYRDMRRLRMSESKEVTEAMVVVLVYPMRCRGECFGCWPCKSVMVRGQRQ
jgi:hypothetical protein